MYSYNDNLEDAISRREYLQKYYFFNCQCELCRSCKLPRLTSILENEFKVLYESCKNNVMDSNWS